MKKKIENSTGHKIEFSVHVTLAKMKSAIHVWYKEYLACFFFKKKPSDEQLILEAKKLQNPSVNHL